MSRFGLYALMAALACGIAAAEELCLPGQLDSYSACEAGGLVFSDFQYDSSGAGAPAEGDIDVTPLSGGTAGLRFTTDDGWTNPSEAWIRYTVTVNPAVNRHLYQVSLDATVGLFLGAYTVGKYLCANGAFEGTPSGGSATGGLSCSGGGAGSMSQSGFQLLAAENISLSAGLSPTLTSIGVLDYVSLTGLVSTITLLDNTFHATAIPEPGTNLLVGLSLIILAGALRLRARRSRWR